LKVVLFGLADRNPVHGRAARDNGMFSEVAASAKKSEVQENGFPLINSLEDTTFRTFVSGPYSFPTQAEDG
jgi:hypothetical protein